MWMDIQICEWGQCEWRDQKNEGNFKTYSSLRLFLPSKNSKNKDLIIKIRLIPKIMTLQSGKQTIAIQKLAQYLK